jgi:3-hydroxybutyryl-CoA dehydratase
MLPSESASIESIGVGDSASCRFTVTSTQIEFYAEFSQDDNPLHTDDQFAQQRGFAGRVAHGMLSLGAISRLIGTCLPGAGSLWIAQELDFVTPVLANDALEAQVIVQKVSRAARIVVLSTVVTNVDTGAIVLLGLAKVRIPPLGVNGASSDKLLNSASTVEFHSSND